jgi:TPR repeat protein
MKQNDSEAIKLIQAAANAGDDLAQDQMGLLYADGFMTAPNYSEAYFWLKVISLDRAKSLSSGEYEEANKRVQQRNKKTIQDMGPIQIAEGAINRADYGSGVNMLRSLAEVGNPTAAFDLGVLYSHGRGVKQDYTESMRWYRKASQGGLSKADGYIGMMYMAGWGVKQDYSQALKWIRRGAEKGSAEAESYLGNLYVAGFGVNKDLAEGVHWFVKAANDGDLKGQVYSSYHYKVGAGVLPDRKESYYWAAVAAQNVADKLNKEQISAADERAEKWRPIYDFASIEKNATISK